MAVTISEPEKVVIKARHNAMQWALQTARVGEDAAAILARAQLYSEFVIGVADWGAASKPVAQTLKHGL